MPRSRFTTVSIVLLLIIEVQIFCSIDREQRSPLRLIMILNRERTTHYGLDTLPAVLAVALMEQAAPILTTGAVLVDFLMAAKNLDAKKILCKKKEQRTLKQALECIHRRSAINRELLDAFANGDLRNEYGMLLQQWKHLKLNNFVVELIEYYLWSEVSFDGAQWLCARGNNDLASLFLLIPRRHVGSTIHNRTSQEALAALGFDPTVFTVIDLKKVDESSMVAEFEDDEKDWPIGDLRKCFLPRSGPWNMYMSGHGLPGIYDDGNSLVAGISRKQFRDFIGHLQDTVVTNFFYYVTCYGGGYHLISLFDDFASDACRHNPLHFTIACGTTTDTVSDGFCFTRSLFLSRDGIIAARKSVLFGDLAQSCPHLLQRIPAPLDFHCFFSVIESMGTKQCKGLTPRNEEWKCLLRAVSGGINNATLSSLRTTPLLRIAGSNDFQAIPLDSQIALVTDSLLSDMRQRSRYIVFENKKGLLLYAASVTIPVVLKGAQLPTIISMVPEPMIHYFSDLVLVDGFVEDFFRAMHGAKLKLVTHKILVIGSLVARSSSRGLMVLHDVIINCDQNKTIIMGKSGNQWFKYDADATGLQMVRIMAREFYSEVEAMALRLASLCSDLHCRNRALVSPALLPTKSEDFLAIRSRGDLPFELFMPGYDCKYRSFQYANTWYQNT